MSHNEWNRKYIELILTLKDTVKYLIKYVHSNGTSSLLKSRSNNGSTIPIEDISKDDNNDDDNYILNEKNEFVIKICEIIEKIFILDIKIIEFHRQIPLWGLFEQLDLSNSSDNNPNGIIIYPTLRANMDSISSHHEYLRTPLAKARAMIRQCLNCHCMDDLVSCIVKQPQLVTHFYYQHSIFHSKEDSNILVSPYNQSQL